jgi:hypothetical protein
VIEKQIDKRFAVLAAQLRETALQHGPVVAKALDLIAGELMPHGLSLGKADLFVSATLDSSPMTAIPNVINHLQEWTTPPSLGAVRAYARSKVCECRGIVEKSNISKRTQFWPAWAMSAPARVKLRNEAKFLGVPAERTREVIGNEGTGFNRAFPLPLPVSCLAGLQTEL